MFENVKVEVDNERAKDGCESKEAGNTHIKDCVNTWPCKDFYEECGVC